MRPCFSQAVETLGALIQGDEVFTAFFEGETSDFVRFNKSSIRQPGSVRQALLGLRLIRGQKQVLGQCDLGGCLDSDRERLRALVKDLRARLGEVDDDPFLLVNREPENRERVLENRLPDREAAVGEILAAGVGRDLVGIYAQGGIFRGYASSYGQSCWFESHSFNLDATFYAGGDKAVKWGYAGLDFDPSVVRAKVERAAPEVQKLQQTPRTLDPGVYRVYLTPAAVAELLEFVNWNSFGLASHRTKQTPWLRLTEGRERLDPRVRLSENTAEGVGPMFGFDGFLKPDEVVLLEDGRYRDCLVSPRSAREYGVPTNGATDGESAESLDLASGDLPQDRVLAELGTGVYINHLWYLNHSDRASFRVTGMTRYATFWVENGQLCSPLNVMRFDESLYRVLGGALVALTAEREMILSPKSYEKRSTGSWRVPGLLLDSFRFTL